MFLSGAVGGLRGWGRGLLWSISCFFVQRAPFTSSRSSIKNVFFCYSSNQTSAIESRSAGTLLTPQTAVVVEVAVGFGVK